MTDGSTEPDGTRDAFSLLAHDIRLDIVLALLGDWAAVYTEPQSYSELMDAVGMQDSGKFNYHLDKLRGVYVAETDEGYVPTASATALYRAVLAHRPTTRTEQTGELDRDCPHCGGTLVERYERAFYTLECTTCDAWNGMTYSFPQNGLRNREGGERYQAVAQRANYHIGLAQTGQCPFCGGSVPVTPEPDWADGTAVALGCDTCSWAVGVSPLTAVQFVPAVTSALHDAGVELPLFEHAVTGFTTTTRHTADPPTIEIQVETEAGQVTVVADESLSVRSVEGPE